MKAARFDHAGKPEDILEVIEIPTPEPAAGEIRVKVIASPINPSDVMFVQNLYGIRPVFPSGAGFEGVGLVDACGEGVTMPIGQRVSFTSIGTWGEYAITQAKTAIPIPPSMPDDVAAQLFVNPFTAYAMVLDSGVAPGEWLMLTAVGSAFGKMVIQVCKMKGIKTIGTVRRPDMIEELKALGADEIIDTSQESVTRRVKDITGGAGVKCILEAVAGKTAAQVLPCLSSGGKMLIYGSLSVEDIPVNAGVMIFKEIMLKGFWLTTWMKTASPEARKEVLTNVVQLLASGEIKLPVEATYSLAQIKEAVIHAQQEGRTGKILVRP
ncbi:MAG: zinc-dependent alcohol dehydrogenase family protein [Spirosomataceae bacterium]